MSELKPVLSAAEWDEIEAYIGEPDVLREAADSLVRRGDFPALVALANAARADDDPGKLTRTMLAAVEWFLEESPIGPHDDMAALAAALRSILPPEGR